MRTCDIVLVGVGGQGVVTLGDLVARAALAAHVPVSYVPSKGMAQRGGFVKVEIRLGYESAGPRIPKSGADIVVSMERSEALTGVQFIRPNGRFILYDHVWEPAGVMLGNDDYPAQKDVLKTLGNSCKDVFVLNPDDRPVLADRPVAANVLTLGALFNTQILRDLLSPSVMKEALLLRWPKSSASNAVAFDAGVSVG